MEGKKWSPGRVETRNHANSVCIWDLEKKAVEAAISVYVSWKSSQ
jgi:hypothetical protein